jgi:hypothetical protein
LAAYLLKGADAMALAFEVIKNLTTEVDHNVEPYFVRTPHLIHEPDNGLFQYYIKPDTSAAWDKRTDVVLGQYKELSWDDLQHHLSTRAVSNIGAKHFPHIGAIGFYKDLYTSQSYILAPVHARQNVFRPPTITATLSGDTVKLVITSPENVTYTCYKVILRSGYFAVEYVVYNTDTSVDKPPVKGVYEVAVIGYNELTGMYSSPSNIVTITVTDGKDTWEPEAFKAYFKLSDLADVSIVDLLNAQMLRYNAATQRWENAFYDNVVSITLLAANWQGSAGKFSQVVSIAGITPYSKVDLQPNVEQIAKFRELAVTFTTENNNGIVTVYAVGEKLTSDYTIQATITEVNV